MRNEIKITLIQKSEENKKNKYGMISTNFDTRTELSHIVYNFRVFGK